MNIKELVEILKKFPGNYDVYIEHEVFEIEETRLLGINGYAIDLDACDITFHTEEL